MATRVPWWLTLAVAAGACGGPPRPAAKTVSDSVATADSLRAAGSSAATAAPTAAGTASPTTAAADSAAGARAAAQAVAVALPPNAFRHEKHRALKCQRCHTNVPGHETHDTIACTSCHAPVPVTGPAPTPDQCGACHHASAQRRSCLSCHDPRTRGVLTVQRTWKLSVWAAPRQRELHFDHRWHAGVQCSACHTERPGLVSNRACGSCHVHHEGKADCRICHQTPPAGVHTVAAHGGCAASGCHQNPPVRVATLSRDECLLCHPDKVNHQPGRACAQCHMLEPARASPAGSAGEEPERP